MITKISLQDFLIQFVSKIIQVKYITDSIVRFLRKKIRVKESFFGFSRVVKPLSHPGATMRQLETTDDINTFS